MLKIFLILNVYCVCASCLRLTQTINETFPQINTELKNFYFSRMSSQVVSTDNATVIIQINPQVVQGSAEGQEKSGLYQNTVLKNFLKVQPKSLGVNFSRQYFFSYLVT